MSKRKTKGTRAVVAKPRCLYIAVEGGIVQSVSSPRPDELRDLRVTLIDYDTDGMDQENLSRVKQADGREELARVRDLPIGRTAIVLGCHRG